MLCRRCTSYWYYVIGTSPRSARSKLRFLSFCDQNPWKDVKSSIVFFFKFVSIDDLTFRQKQKKIRVTGTLKYLLPRGIFYVWWQEGNRSYKRLISCRSLLELSIQHMHSPTTIHKLRPVKGLFVVCALPVV